MLENNINRILIFLIYLSVFVNSITFSKEPVEIYVGYIAYVLLFPVFIPRFRIPIYMIIVFLFLFVFGVVNIIAGNNSIAQFSKIYIGVFASYIFYYYVLAQFNFDVEKLFKMYLTGCVVVSLIGLFQLLSFRLNFEPGYNFEWILNKWGVVRGGNLGIRVNSVFPEPTYFAACVSAGAFISIYNLVMKETYFLTKLQSGIILLAYVFSFSGVAFIALFIMVVIFLLNYGFVRYVLVLGPVIIIVFYYLYNNVPEFTERYDSTTKVFDTGDYSIGQTHGSSIILYNNYVVALKNFSTNFLFGTGLGSHPHAFAKYSVTKHIHVEGFANNSQDANSMLLRLISETGLFGVVLMLGLTVKFFVNRQTIPDAPPCYWLISGAILTMIVVNLLRQGHYFLNGFPFFIWLYYFNHTNLKKYKQEMGILKE
jgi:hypothetical protein